MASFAHLLAPDGFLQLNSVRSYWTLACAYFPYAALFLIAAALWAFPARRALDLPVWHEFDDAAIARNYIDDSTSFFEPRIDWRGDGPGITESEFPLYPWLLSQVYRAFGVDILWGRILSLIATLGALFFFMRIARSMLPLAGAVVAMLLFVGNRIVNAISTSLQPEAFMLFFYLAGVYTFLRWRQNRSLWNYGFAIVLTSLAILEKLPAAHLGLFFLLLIFAEDGWTTLKDKYNWLFGILTLLAPLLWYWHARRLWFTYGNSLGISNENHWIGLDVLRRPNLWASFVAIEVLFVFAIGALPLAATAVINWRKDRPTRTILLWCASVLICYIITIRTTAGYWASYYHVVSVPPVALLAGAGAVRLLSYRSSGCVLFGGTATGAMLTYAVMRAAERLRLPAAQGLGHNFLHDMTAGGFQLKTAILLAIAFGAVGFVLYKISSKHYETLESPARVAGLLFGAALGCYLITSAEMIAGDLSRYRQQSAERQCTEQFRAVQPQSGLLVASGYTCDDGYGHKIASDAPYMFYWLSRRGFSICSGDQSVARLVELSARGATSFAAEKAMVNQMPGFEQDLKRNFQVLATCDAGWLFDLRKSGSAKLSEMAVRSSQR